MSLPDYKNLKKLADFCRKTGIKHYKCDEFEFTLSDDKPVSNYKKRTEIKSKRELQQDSLNDDIAKENSLTEEELLFWSTGPELSNEGN